MPGILWSPTLFYLPHFLSSGSFIDRIKKRKDIPVVPGPTLNPWGNTGEYCPGSFISTQREEHQGL